jgi:hypothetical protein
MSASSNVGSSRPQGEAQASGPIDGRYTLLEQLGAGGMGVVHRARDDASGRIVALKQLRSSAVSGNKRRMFEALFEREYDTLVRLRHPRIVEAYEYGLTDEGPYYTMELLEGQDLSRLGKVPYREACRHLRDVASSLALLHAHRLLHRDVSPRNIRLTPDGRAKLFDFGALTAFGASNDIVGTPVCMAPEVVHEMQLDQKTDLYALGAVAFFLLTGRHAYPARRVSDLPEAWLRAVPPPSELVPDIPQALDHLVLSLLSFDALSRPPSAAAVIDQLTAIADLPPEENDHSGEAYLSSSRMVGRQTERQWAARRLTRALAGKGAEVIIQGPSGIGKTRLLYELCLDAQLKGVTPVKADAQSTPGPFGVAIALALGLLRSSPDVAKRAAEPYAALLVHLSPELGEALGDTSPMFLSPSPTERRARFQTALFEWFLAVARERTLVLAVDNLQTVDDNSASFLSALGREVRNVPMMVLTTLRTGDAIAAPEPVHMMRERASRMKLVGLNPPACEELVRSLFGDVANTGRVAKLLGDRSGGNPQQCTDLVRILVRKKIAKYVGGTWILPLDVSAEELPSRVEEIVDARLSALSPDARKLACALSIRERPIPIELCLTALAGKTEREMYAAQGELVAEQILLSEGGSYRFCQESMRVAILARLDAPFRRATYLRAAENLLENATETVSQRVEAALYLLDAGEESRGAELLARVGWEFVRGTGTDDGPDQVARALQKAVAVYERQNRSEYELAALLFPLIPIAYYSSHWRVVLENAERTLEIGLRITGLGLACKLAPFIGRKLALKAGLLAGERGFSKQRRRGLEYDLKTAIVSCSAIVPAAIGTCATCLDDERVARLRNIVEPLTLFGSDHIGALMVEFAEGETLLMGREGEARARFAHLSEVLQHPPTIQALGEGRAKALLGGVFFNLGIIDSYRFGRGALLAAEKMELLGVRTWAMAADQVRLLYHSFRGESERVSYFRERAELFAVQGSTTWQVEMFYPALLLNGDFLTRDTISARRTWEQLARRAKDVEALRPFANAAHAAYLALRGEPEAAMSLYEETLPNFPIKKRVGWETTRAYYADVLNRAGRHDRAREVALEVVSNMAAEDHLLVGHFLEPQRQLALAEAGLGNTEDATRQLDGLLERCVAEDNPLLVGLLHKARAEVAVLVQDAVSFETHFAEMERRFRSTSNPALFAQWERLVDRATKAGVRRAPAKAIQSRAWDAGQSATVAPVGDLTLAPNPSEAALRLLVERALAKTGYLYAFHSGSLRLICASGPNEPPPGIETELRVRVEQAEDNTAEPSHESSKPGEAAGDEDVTQFIASARPPPNEGLYRFFVLRAEGAGPAVGGVILEVEAEQGLHLEPAVLQAVARVLRDHPGLSTGYSHA